jgi:methyltransferase (TIGR00027 family)
MALFRALETARPADRRVCDDPFAETFLAAPLRLAVRMAKVPAAGALIAAYIDRRWPGARTSAVARTRFIDEAVTAALSAGVEQFVILGAGFDARAYRMKALNTLKVFEVDHPSTSAAKQRSVGAALGAMPAQVRFVPVDFDAGSLADSMRARRLRREPPDVFFCGRA